MLNIFSKAAPTFEGITKSLADMADQLADLAAANIEGAGELRVQAADINAEALALEDEAKKASSVAEKIADLLA